MIGIAASSDNPSLEIEVSRYQRKSRLRDDLINRDATIGFGNKSYRGRVSRLGRQITLGDNNHPALLLEVHFRSYGELPAGLAAKNRD